MFINLIFAKQATDLGKLLWAKQATSHQQSVYTCLLQHAPKCRHCLVCCQQLFVLYKYTAAHETSRKVLFGSLGCLMSSCRVRSCIAIHMRMYPVSIYIFQLEPIAAATSSLKVSTIDCCHKLFLSKS